MSNVFWSTTQGIHRGNGEILLTFAEVSQLQNIGTTTISAAQIGYVGAMDQGVATTDDVVFNSVVTGTFSTVATVVDAATYDVLATDSHLEVEYTTTGSCAITLPDAQRVDGREIKITDTGGSAGTNNITIKDTGGSTLFTINIDGNSWSLKSNDDDSKWYGF